MMRNGVIGSTADSDSVSRGSSPFSVAGNLRRAFSLFYRSVAQLGRALRSGRRGRRFKSCHSDFFIGIPQSLMFIDFAVFLLPFYPAAPPYRLRIYFGILILCGD